MLRSTKPFIHSESINQVPTTGLRYGSNSVGQQVKLFLCMIGDSRINEVLLMNFQYIRCKVLALLEKFEAQLVSYSGKTSSQFQTNINRIFAV